MNSKNTFSLTDYQLGMLTQMGISSWRLQTSGDGDAITPVSEPETPIEKSLPVAISQFKKTTAAVQAQVTSIPGQLLLVMSVEQSEERLVADILLAARFSSTQTKTIVKEDVGNYCDFDFAWQFGQNIDMSGKILTTLALDKMQLPDYKRQLWKILSAYGT
ncbi:MAG: DNA polymerase III psi subunit [Paraglaciecola sp.]|jgi:DNA polymerase III psi subunit